LPVTNQDCTPGDLATRGRSHSHPFHLTSDREPTFTHRYGYFSPKENV